MTDSKVLVPSHMQSHNPLSVALIAVGGNRKTRRKPTLKRGQAPTSSAHDRHLGVKCLAQGHKVAAAGFEPTTIRSVGECSTNWATTPLFYSTTFIALISVLFTVELYTINILHGECVPGRTKCIGSKQVKYLISHLSLDIYLLYYSNPIL